MFEVAFGLAFTGLEWKGYFRTAGILEWVMTFTGGFYLLCFIGYLWFVIQSSALPDGADDYYRRADEYTVALKEDGERAPLLVPSQD